MSLEATIAENTSAIRELIAALKTGVPTGERLTVTETKAEKPGKESAKAETAKAIETAQTAAAYAEQKAIIAEPPVVVQMTAAEAEKATFGAANRPAAATYQDAATAITNLAKTKGKPAAVELLARFGATKLPEVKPDDFAAIIAAAEEVSA